jgi:hypothetical protein
MKLVQVLALLFFFIVCKLSGQTTEVFITGNIKSASTRTVIEKTTVLVIQNSKIIGNVQTGDNGNFSITVPEGAYTLKYFKAGYDSATKSNINLKDGEQVILTLYLKEKRELVSCNPITDNGFQVYDKSCLINPKMIKGELSPEEVCGKYIKYPCMYQVRKIKFHVIINESGKLVFTNQLAAVDNSNKQYGPNDKYPFWEDAGKEGKRILATIPFDIPKLKINQQAVKVGTIIEVPISCK